MSATSSGTPFEIPIVDSVSYAFTAAIVSYSNRQTGRDLISTAQVFVAHPKTKNEYKKTVRKVLQTWSELGHVPPDAISFVRSHFPDVFASYPKLFERTRTDTNGDFVSSVCTDRGEPNVAESATSTSGIPLTADTDDDMWEDIREEPDFRNLEDLLGTETLNFLFGTNREKVKRIPFRMILQHWFVSANISHVQGTKLLKLIKKYNATLTEEDIEALPFTARNLLKLTEDERRQVETYDVYDETKEKVGELLHFGVLPGVLGTSAGELATICHS